MTFHRAFPIRPRSSPWQDEKSIREELFSAERLEQHAESLAMAQRVTARPIRARPLTDRLSENARLLLAAYRSIAAAVDEGRVITPSAEWLIDNYHLVEDQIGEVREDLPPGYYRQLPKLADGPFAGYPRVFGLAWAFVAHTDSRFDPDVLCRFVQAYQRVQPLTIGELWAIAITLRIVLVENLRRAAMRIVRSAAARREADILADRVLGADDRAAEPGVMVFQKYEQIPLPSALAVQLVQRLRDQDPHVTPALAWLEERLAAQGTTAEDVVREEHQTQGGTNVTVRNIITSMRLISDVDWTDLFEKISLVDDLLRSRSGFSDMDFATRNLYRTAIEKIARNSERTELEIAQMALDSAREEADSGGPANSEIDRRKSDPGYHLIAGGRAALEARAGFRPPLRIRLRRLTAKLGIGGYAGGIAIVAALILFLPLYALAQAGIAGWCLLGLALLGVFPALDAAVALANRGITSVLGPSALPALALRDGVPAHLRTLVAVPFLLTSRDSIEEQVERLEIHYLTNPDDDFCFALLSDWTDAATERVDGDEELLAVAREGVARLNLLHESDVRSERFFVLQRRRIWNESEKIWMGWERKRGKLHELNRLLRGATDTTFLETPEQLPTLLSSIRYVITLDADTRLPRDSARRLVGKMAHPLNQPCFDAAAGRVVEGYTILQPRVTPSLPVGREASPFQRVFSSASGIDPYASAVSDVYQDLFREGSYTGKGIYDVDAFESALDGRVPDNTLLSHDLFEGIFARAGLASDVEVVEEFPARYDVSASRQHRWARGDWQLLPWIFGRGPSAAVTTRPSAVPPVGLWKMLDNLRRTLSAPAAVAALLAGWTLPRYAALVWTGFILVTIACPALIALPGKIVPQRAGISLRGHFYALGDDLRLALSQMLLVVVFLADQAWMMADAIGRTLYRLFVSRRHLLEWVPAAQAQARPRPDMLGFYQRMLGGAAIGVAVAIVIWLAGRHNWFVAAPFVVAWIASPAVAQWASRSAVTAGRLPVAPADAAALRLTARRTWRFFETFVTLADNMLPPDNFQEEPHPVVAHRTSPTNIGVYLLSTVAAYDFGWASAEETAVRLEAAIATMGKLQQFRGHFFNWYDTQDLRPLEPKYISSVDSGNLAGHLIAAANACREWSEGGTFEVERLAGIADCLDLARESLRAIDSDDAARSHAIRQLGFALDALAEMLLAPLRQAEDPQARLLRAGEQAAQIVDDASNLAQGLKESRDAAEFLDWALAMQRTIAGHRTDAGQTDAQKRSLEQRFGMLEIKARAMAEAMQFGFLMDPQRKLLSIGYSMAEGQLDPSCYDLLASEARLASFFAIAKGDVAARHWFRLGRGVASINGAAALMSWSGSMFEYLMPALVMRAPSGSLLEQTARLIVRRQIGYGDSLHIPWGVSESGYNARDAELTYQYSNFGVPGLGLKRGLSENAVIAPYATALAAMVDPHAAATNFCRLAEIGARGRFGFYEAVDYTRSRLPEGHEHAVIHAYMAHHQGMTIVAIANALSGGRMRSRFHAEPIVRATELLLQERTPRDVVIAHPRAEEIGTAPRIRDVELAAVRRFTSAHDATPATHLLSNGRYSVMLTAAGSGFSRWRDLAVTRWREDPTRDDWGAYIYLRDVASGQVWSAGYQPSATEPDDCEITFSEDRAAFVRHDGAIRTTLDVVVSPEDDAEIRHVSISNLSFRVAEIELTSYAELVLASSAADAAHPAFSKLFVQTEFVAELGALVATRRRRSPNEPEIWAGHIATVEGLTVGAQEFETDRARFVGRGRDVRAPVAMTDGGPLSGTVGTVLDPIFALRRRLRIPRGATARVAFCTLVASSRDDLLALIDKYRDASAYERAGTLSWTQAQVQLRHLEIDPAEANLFQRVAGHILYSAQTFRPSSDTIRNGMDRQSGLWPHGISGDLPIVLVRIDDVEDVEIVRQMLRAHEYWRMKGLATDLVILNERVASYNQDLHVALETLVRMSQAWPRIGDLASNRAVFVLRADLISPQAKALLAAAARVVFFGRRGRLSDQLSRLKDARAGLPPAVPRRQAKSDARGIVAPAPDLEFFNGLGGFAFDGREYVTILGPGQSTPAPWINVIANPVFGFHVAVEGGGYTWSLNSRDNQLTPWPNDPVSNISGEAIYLRDDDTGEVWCPTVAPIRENSALYVVRHGMGYSRFEHTSHGIALALLQYVPSNDPIKISRLTIRNLSDRRRRISVTTYAEWVLGASRGASAPFVATEIDLETGAMLARNPWNMAYGARVAFADLGGRQTSWTGDRKEFIGRNGTLAVPDALSDNAALSGRVGSALDPCSVLQAALKIEANATDEVVFFLGEAASADEARNLVARYRAADLDAVFQEVTGYWAGMLTTVQVKTPDRSLDVMLNGWLLYQALVSRIWARSGFYQASGAYGFRDQLQDAMALVVAKPELTREHLLRAAARQFVEGDVQHWWLPETGQGVRTRITDDRIWLAYAAAHYVEATGDAGILDETVPFLEGHALREGEEEAFFTPMIADESGSLFEHCARALDLSLDVGKHGLPLIGTGDWNDGMNRVGEKGAGESVWLGWFLHTALSAFVPLAQARKEPERAKRWQQHGAALQASIEQKGWDGGWYRRAYFDDGTPLGSAENRECRIDSIAQSWSVISGLAGPARAARAMAALDRHLVRRTDGLAVLLTPPFDKSLPDPGYIKGYPPGIRENGGQYTHATLWAAIAFAKLGDGDKAAELLSMSNPINRARTGADTDRNKVEPYVVAADVYSSAPHTGRGGWTWYTGSAAWMYRTGLESILGFRLEGPSLVLDPCVPTTWPGFTIAYRYRSTRYEIVVENPRGVSRGVTRAELDGQILPRAPVKVPLTDDGAVHVVHVTLG